MAGWGGGWYSEALALAWQWVPRISALVKQGQRILGTGQSSRISSSRLSERRRLKITVKNDRGRYLTSTSGLHTHVRVLTRMYTQFPQVWATQDPSSCPRWDTPSCEGRPTSQTLMNVCWCWAFPMFLTVFGSFPGWDGKRWG